MAVMMLADPESHWRLWAGAVGIGLTAVGTNAIAMSMLIRDPAFGPVTVASGFVSVAFFGGFALGPPFFGVMSSYSGGLLFGWECADRRACMWMHDVFSIGIGAAAVRASRWRPDRLSLLTS